MNNKVFLPEWSPQSAVLMAWPHTNSDWAYMLEEVQHCVNEIITAIAEFQSVVLIIPNKTVQKELKQILPNNVIYRIIETNDTWARDFGPIFIQKSDKLIALDFKFNGWGLKHSADKDNLINQHLFNSNLFSEKNVQYANRLNFVAEGGALESDGEGTLLTTSECLLSPNRNGEWDKNQIESYLKDELGLNRVLWLNHGYLAGDDTDSHIDTLARFCSPNTIAYVQCLDEKDEHFGELQKMEQELKSFRTSDGNPYQLIPLPMADEVQFDGHRLPATYANFLIVNGAVLVPTYNSTKDELAISQLQIAFLKHKIVGINCLPLIKQHGSLHCVTMQLPEGVMNVEI